MEKKINDTAAQRPPSEIQGFSEAVVISEDPTVEAFYYDAVSESYRLKSELVAQHLAEIGMGQFQ